MGAYKTQLDKKRGQNGRSAKQYEQINTSEHNDYIHFIIIPLMSNFENGCFQKSINKRLIVRISKVRFVLFVLQIFVTITIRLYQNCYFDSLHFTDSLTF